MNPGGLPTDVCRRLAAQKPVDGFRQLANLLGRVAGLDGLGNAVLSVRAEQQKASLFECRPGRVDLGQDVDAVAVFGDHALDASNLALDALQPRIQSCLACRVPGHGPRLGH